MTVCTINRAFGGIFTHKSKNMILLYQNRKQQGDEVVSNHIKWDTDRIMSHARSINTKKDNLEQQRNFLSNINDTVQNAWQGIAGAKFDERMDVDIDNFNIIIKDLTSLINDLNKAADNCYRTYEEKIISEIHSLRGKIS